MRRTRLGVVMVVAVVALGVVGARAYVPGDGKGKPEADCLIGLEGYADGDLSPFGKKGKPAIQCTDCDPACDLDGVATPNGSCTFSIAVRVNDAGVPACTPAALKKVKAKAKTKGTKIDFGTSFQAPLDGSSATSSFVDFPVLVKKFGKPKAKPGKGKVTLLAKKLEKPKLKDKDKFLFVCNPLPEGDVCPGGTTSTTLGTTSTTLETTTTTLGSTTTTVTTTSSSTVTLVLPVLTTSTLVLPTLITLTTTTTTSTTPTIVLPILTTSTLVLPTLITLTTTTTTSTIGTIVLPILTTSTLVLPTLITLTTTTTTSTIGTIVLPILTTTTLVLPIILLP